MTLLNGKILMYKDPKALRRKARKNILTAVGLGAAGGLGAYSSYKMMTGGDAAKSRKLIGLALASSIAAIGSAGVGVSQLRTAKRVGRKLKGYGIES